MKHIAFCIAATLTLSPAYAAEEGVEDGFDLFSRGAELILRNLMDDIEPKLRELEPALREIEPFLNDLQAMMPDLDLYHMPEIMPNGDIIIRRKAPKADEPEMKSGEIDL